MRKLDKLQDCFIYQAIERLNHTHTHRHSYPISLHPHTQLPGRTDLCPNTHTNTHHRLPDGPLSKHTQTHITDYRTDPCPNTHTNTHHRLPDGPLSKHAQTTGRENLNLGEKAGATSLKKMIEINIIEVGYRWKEYLK